MRAALLVGDTVFELRLVGLGRATCSIQETESRGHRLAHAEIGTLLKPLGQSPGAVLPLRWVNNLLEILESANSGSRQQFSWGKDRLQALTLAQYLPTVEVVRRKKED